MKDNEERKQCKEHAENTGKERHQKRKTSCYKSCRISAAGREKGRRKQVRERRKQVREQGR